MNSVSPHQLMPCGRSVAGIRAPPASVSVLVAAYSPGIEGPTCMPESTFPPDNEAWSTKTARIIALRKEKSRDAARSRRGKENYEYYELAKMLPLPSAITSQLDKASIIRLTISYLKIRDFAMQGDPPWHNYMEGHHCGAGGAGVGRGISSVLQGRFSQQHSGISAIAQEVYEHNLGGHILQAFDGFLFALSNDGRFLYISETVSIYLGLSQVELTGSSVFDYIHAGDRAELAEQLGMKLPTPRPLSQTSPGSASSDGCQSSPLDSPTSPHSEPLGLNMTSADNFYLRSFVIRMKSTLTKRGVHIKSSGYKVIHIMGSLRPRMVLTQYSSHAPVIMGFTAVAQSLPPPTINEIHLEPTMFVCKLDLDLTIVFCEAKIQEFIDLTPDDVTDKSLYSFVHAQDIRSMRNCHSDLLSKGQMITHYYRWMCKSGGYVWVQSTATLAYARTSNDRSFMFINQVISNAEAVDTVMDISQMTSLPMDGVKAETSEGSGHESDIGNASTDEGKGKSPKTEKGNKPVKRTAQETTTSRGKASSRNKKRKAQAEPRDAKRQRQPSPDEIAVRPFPAGEDPAVPKTVIVDGSAVEAAGGHRGSAPQSRHGNARKPKKVMEDQHSRQQSREERSAPAVTGSPLDQASGGSGGSEAACRHCEAAEVAAEREPSPACISPADHQSVHSKDSDSLNSGSHHAAGQVGEGWDNPPNREVPRELEVPHGYREAGRPVGADNSIVIPKASYCKGSNTGCSPKPPESMLTPPLSDSCQSQFVLPPVSAVAETAKTKHYAAEGIPAGLTGISSSNNNNPPLPPPPPTQSQLSKGFHHQPALSPDVELAGHQPGPPPGLAGKSQPPSDVESGSKPEHLYNTHPRVITAVSSAYASMPYAGYGQYSNFQQYANPVNLAAHHGYQAGHYPDPYKNFRSAHHDMPMDLSTYNNMGTYANVSLLHGNVGGSTAPHPYYHTGKMGYSTAPESGIQILPDRPCLEDPTKGTNGKV